MERVTQALRLCLTLGVEDAAHRGDGTPSRPLADQCSEHTPTLAAVIPITRQQDSPRLKFERVRPSLELNEHPGERRCNTVEDFVQVLVAGKRDEVISDLLCGD